MSQPTDQEPNQPEITRKKGAGGEQISTDSGLERSESRDQTQTQQVSASDVLSGFKGAGKITGANILEGMSNSSGNLHMKSDIASASAYSTIHIVADYLADNGFESTAKIDRSFANYYEQFAVSVKGERAKAILKAVESVLKQDFEIEKSKARSMMGANGT